MATWPGNPTMSPGRPWSQLTDVPPARWVPELSGPENPAFCITYAVRPEQSKPISLPPPQTYGKPRALNPAARPVATAALGAVIVRPAMAGVTLGLFGMVTSGPLARTAPEPVASVFLPPPVDPNSLVNM